jgi:CSLREA domain-containing protein
MRSRSFGPPARQLLVAAVASAGLLAVPGLATAATVEVSTTADEYGPGSSCSLREAVESTNGDADFGGCVGEGAYGDDTILLPGGVYALTRSGGLEDANNLGDIDVWDPNDTNDPVAIRRAGAAPVTIDGSAGGDRVIAVRNGGPLTLDALTIRGGDAGPGLIGGGIAALLGSDLTVTNSTITGNSSGGGAIGVGFSETRLINVTISGNQSVNHGGGIAHNNAMSDTTLRNVTITGNTADSDNNGTGDGGGLRISSGTLNMVDTVVAGNTDRSGGAPDCAEAGTAELSSQGNSLIGDTTGCGGLAPGPGDITNRAARLGPSLNNGGPTPTHALLARSPAINRGTQGDAPPTDQRGLFRVGRPDIGAYERVLCRGVAVNRFGTPVGDVLVGTPKADGILGFDGRDVLRGLGGKDALCGAKGRDRLIGGRGADRLVGGPGPDRLLGGAGRDLLLGGPGRDRLLGGPGRDRLLGGPGRDRLRGGPGRDRQKQ